MLVYPTAAIRLLMLTGCRRSGCCRYDPERRRFCWDCHVLRTIPGSYRGLSSGDLCGIYNLSGSALALGDGLPMIGKH